MVTGRGLIGAMAAIVGAFVAVPGAALAGDASFFKLQLSVRGDYTVDYGDPPGPNTSDFSGVARASYSSDLVGVARHRRGSEQIESKLNNTRTRAKMRASTAVVSHFPGSEPQKFDCDNGRGSQVTFTQWRDHFTGTPAFARNLGTIIVSGSGGDRKGIRYGVGDGPHFDANCFSSGHGPITHYLHSPDSPGVLGADGTVIDCCTIPRGAFNPNSDRRYSDTFSRDIHFDPGPNPHPESPDFPTHLGADPPHVFDGSSSVSFKIKRISERKAKRIRKTIHRFPEAAE